MNIQKPWLLTARAYLRSTSMPQLTDELSKEVRLSVSNTLAAFLAQRLGIGDWDIATDGRIDDSIGYCWDLTLILHDWQRDMPTLTLALREDVMSTVQEAMTAALKAHCGKRVPLEVSGGRVTALPLTQPPLPPLKPGPQPTGPLKRIKDFACPWTRP